MVFSSVPVYLDPPNWHHQQQNHHHQGTGSENPQLAPLPSAAHVVGVGVGGGPGGGGSSRPGSMADRARLAKIPQPEAPLKCPRCDSTNTKFCYFNNYSLSQPRHFCKTCRRYWTRGGALRNVPVGGGCRRNKKSKSSSSNNKSTANNNPEKPQMGSSNSTSTLDPSEIMGHLQQQTPQIPLMPSLHNLSHYNMGNIGLNFGTDQMGFQMGTNSTGGVVQQFPFFEHAPNTGLYSFQSDQGIDLASSSLVGDHENQLRSMQASNSRVSEQAPVKMEDHRGLNLSRPFLGISDNNQYWSGNNWTDLSGLNNSSTKNPLL